MIMKSYTDIEQSKKLAEILPLESADMIYIMYRDGKKSQNSDADLSTVYESNDHKWYWIDIIDESWDIGIGYDIPCWSLAALLSVIPNYKLNSEHNHHACTAGTIFGEETVAWFDNPIDACYEMILKLDNLKML